MKSVIIYCDGACSGNPGPGGWAATPIYGSHEREISGGVSQTTNNRMELMGAINGYRALKEPCQVTVRSDSRYLAGGFTNGWRLKGVEIGYELLAGGLLKLEHKS